MLPSISARTITFGRPDLLKLAVQDYLAQDYEGPKEMVILNDHPYVEYRHAHPEIKIFNYNYRFKSVYVKVNECVKLCQHELIMPWGDDDEVLPHAMRTAVKYLGNKPYIALYPIRKCKERRDKKTNGAGILKAAHAGVYIMRKDLFTKLKGYEEKAKSDLEWNQKVKKAGFYEEAKMGDDETYMTWCVDKNRRTTWKPSTGEYYIDIPREKEIVYLDV